MVTTTNRKTIGLSAEGGFDISPTAAYPDGMCEWIAKLVFDDWMKSSSQPQRVGLTSRQDGNPKLTADSQRWEPWRTEPCGAAPWLGSNEIIPADEVERATRDADAKGIDHCIKDSIDQALPEPSSEEDNVRSWD